jgi:hypothetical protein
VIVISYELGWHLHELTPCHVELIIRLSHRKPNSIHSNHDCIWTNWITRFVQSRHLITWTMHVFTNLFSTNFQRETLTVDIVNIPAFNLEHYCVIVAWFDMYHYQIVISYRSSELEWSLFACLQWSFNYVTGVTFVFKFLISFQ